ncbi:MAG: prefoldin subunit alpha [Thermoproteus sp.]|nr:prefoldin subunit alpha [Thermoproteus sp.]
MTQQITREDIARLLEEYQAILEVISNLQAQLAVINDTLDELRTALDGIRSLDQQPADRYVHVGAGFFMRATVEVAEILTPLGASYYAFLDRQNAERIINERMSELGKVKASIENNLAKLNERAFQIRDVLERLGLVR